MSRAPAVTRPRPAHPGPDVPFALLVRGLRKAYGRTTAVDDLHLDVPRGTAFALLGPRGAGKTTVVRILAAHGVADGGEARIAGHDLATDAGAVRAAAGLLGRVPAVDTRLTAEENLLLASALRGLPAREGRARAADLLARLGLERLATEPVAALSSGTRRRLALAVLLAGGPRVVLLDEPTAGLAPADRRIVREVVRDLVADGVTVLFTTGSPQEAAALADRIGVLRRGRLVAEGTEGELLRLLPGGHIRLHFAGPDELDAAAGLFRLHTAVRDDTALSLQIPGDGSIGLVRAVLDVLDDARVEPRRLTVHSPGLEDVYRALVDSGPHGPPRPPDRPAQTPARPAQTPDHPPRLPGRAVPAVGAPSGKACRAAGSRAQEVLPVVVALLLVVRVAEAGAAALPGALLTALVCAALTFVGHSRAGAAHIPARRGTTAPSRGPAPTGPP